MAETLRTGQTYSIDHRIIRPDGAVRIIHEQADLVRDGPNGRSLRMVGTAQDVTGQRRAEGVLRAKQAQLLEALRITRLAYWEYDVLRDEFIFNDQFLFHPAHNGGEGGRLHHVLRPVCPAVRPSR